MPTRVSQGAAYAMLDALRTLIEGGTLRIYSGTQPTTASDAVGAGTVLATITGMNFGTVTFASNYCTVAISATESDSSADATGTAAWFRLSDTTDAGTSSTGSGGEPRIDGSVTATGGGGDLELSSLSIVSGNPVNVTAFTIRIPMY